MKFVTSQLKRERVIEQSARDNFSKLIKSLAEIFLVMHLLFDPTQRYTGVAEKLNLQMKKMSLL